MQILLLGNWKTWKEDTIPPKYLTKSDFLDILGVKLYTNFTQTKNINGEILIGKISDIINGWKVGKFMPLTDCSRSINTYALAKLWY